MILQKGKERDNKNTITKYIGNKHVCLLVTIVILQK